MFAPPSRYYIPPDRPCACCKAKPRYMGNSYCKECRHAKATAAMTKRRAMLHSQATPSGATA